MSLFEDSSEWFEISDDLWLDPKFVPKKLKLCADANIPRPIIEEIRQAGIPIRTATEDKAATHSDESILAWVRRCKRVLLTLDRDFWDDKKFPLQSVPGIIFIDVAPNDFAAILRSFGLIFGTFANSYPLDWWEQMKARVLPEGYVLKMRNWDGRTVEYAIKLKSGRIFARELTASESP